MAVSNSELSGTVGLSGKRIAIAEGRELQILARLLRRRGAQVIEVPLVSILDAPAPGPVLAWLREFIEQPPGVLILLTGEGLRRLLDLAEREGCRAAFVAALSRVATLTRGPKPERVLRDLGMGATYMAALPTTEGVIQTLDQLALAGVKVGLQLYGEDPNPRLQQALVARGAVVQPVAPYVYADQEADTQVCRLIEALAAAEVDVLVFTSQPQFRRLQQVAAREGLEQTLETGLRRTVLAAVGPVMKAQLEQAGYSVAIMPQRAYFMKPLVLAIQRYFEA